MGFNAGVLVPWHEASSPMDRIVSPKPVEDNTTVPLKGTKKTAIVTHTT
jgi:hypothetical protein